MSLQDVYQRPEQLIEQIDNGIRKAGMVDVPDHAFFYVFIKTRGATEKLEKYAYLNKIGYRHIKNEGIVRFFWNTKDGEMLRTGYKEFMQDSNETPETRAILKEIRRIGQKDMGMK